MNARRYAQLKAFLRRPARQIPLEDLAEANSEKPHGEDACDLVEALSGGHEGRRVLGRTVRVQRHTSSLNPSAPRTCRSISQRA